MATVDSLHALLEEELKDIYDAEKQLTKALPKLAKKASSPDLKAGFEAHLQQTEEQIERLEQVFDQLEMQLEKPAVMRCLLMSRVPTARRR